jgi:hypothetical protein
MTLSRRRTLKLAASAAVAPLIAGCTSQAAPASAQVPPGGPLSAEAELEDMALDVVVAEQQAMDSAFTFQNFQLDKDLRRVLINERIVPALRKNDLAAEAVADTLSPNYNHLAGQTSANPFRLNAAVLARMATANRFEESFGKALGGKQAQSRIVIFGLRGCRLASGASEGTMADEVQLIEAAIDHRNRSCVMGVWDRTTNKVSAFSATTVPHLLYMQIYRINLHLIGAIKLNDAVVNENDVISEEEKAKRQLPWTANMLGQGLHLMEVGRHQGLYPNLLCQHRTWYGPVLRASERPGYTVNDWDAKKQRVGDNIHPTWPVAGWVIDFASAGCNLIEGMS